MVLQNYVMMSAGVPALMHFSDHVIEKRTITDPLTGRPGVRNVLVFNVDRLNGQEVDAKFSTMAESLASKFQPYLDDKSYRGFDFRVSFSGEGFQRRYSVVVSPRG
ncbi:MAG: hypothetical protein HYX96_06185 [Chloroflexi bacterium]|nr:hypothetical protein [Chloroflexota bacterium]